MENLDVKSTVESRRNFLKKAVYAAPAVVALGALTAPMSAQASLIHKQSPGIIPGSTWSGNYDTTTGQYTNVVREGKLVNVQVKDEAANSILKNFLNWIFKINA